MGTKVFTIIHDAMIQFRSATKRTGMYQYIILYKWLMAGAFPGTQKPMSRSEDYSIQCSLLTHLREESTVNALQSLLLVIGLCGLGKP